MYSMYKCVFKVSDYITPTFSSYSGWQNSEVQIFFFENGLSSTIEKMVLNVPIDHYSVTNLFFQIEK